MLIDAARPRRFAVLRNRPLLMLMLGHFTIDSHVGLLAVLYPLLIDRFGLNLTTVGLVSLAYTGISSLSQPLFGWLADRSGTRLIGLALIWTATMFARFPASRPHLGCWCCWSAWPGSARAPTTRLAP